MHDDLSAAEQKARRLIARGHPDEDVERASGLSLSEVITLRAEAASRPWRAPPTWAPAFVSDEHAQMS